MASEVGEGLEPFSRKQCPVTAEYCRAYSKLALRTTVVTYETVIERIDTTVAAFKDCDKHAEICGVEQNCEPLKKFYH